jgi:uncharacterized protein (DUF433 family)
METIAPVKLAEYVSPGYVAIDWSDCPLVERDSRKLSGVPILKHTRLQADSVVENYESGSPVEEIAENFSISEEVISQVLDYAARWRHSRAQ